MTEKVVKAGIEDVLSSIKRLVREEDRKTPGTLASTNSRKPGKLVLTDALRVNEPSLEKQPQPEKTEAAYKAEDSIKPMLLRACDIVKHAEPAVEQQAKPEPEEGLAGSLSAKIEALEAAIARTEDQWEPDGDSDDAYSGTPNRPLAWKAQAETDAAGNDGAKDPGAKATFIRDPEAKTSAKPQAPEAQPDSLTIDTDALRALIAQVVREELQGVLGQRITRNVRKMVRREIYRALAERELD